MRFAVATAILASQAIQASSTFDDTNHIFASPVTNFNFNLDDEKRGLVSNSVSAGQRQHKHDIRKAKRKRNLMIQGPSGKKANPLKNRNRKVKEEATECDPNAPDMGILRCGSSNYCIESKTSSMGGVCSATDRRRLQACSPEAPCETGDFCNLDLVTSGVCELCPCGDDPEFACPQLGLYEYEVGVPSCIESCTVPNQDPCQEYEIQYVFYYCETFVIPGTETGTGNATGTGNETSVGNETGTGNSTVDENEYYICSYTYVSPECYDVNATCCYSTVLAYGSGPGNATIFSRGYYFTEPYSQNVTVSFNNANTDCEVYFNSQLCNSCMRTDADGLCFSFDCTNAPTGMSGNTCDPGGVAALIPAYSVCAVVGCELCYGGTLSNPTATFPGNYTCQDMLTYTYNEALNGTGQCEYFQYVFNAVCCEGGTICNICGDKELLYYEPSDIVTLPDVGEVPCLELYYGGIFYGLFTPEECPIVSSAAYETCCQEKPPICYVCSDDEPVTNPDETIPFGDDDVTCEELQESGRLQQIPEDACETTQIQVSEVCGCGPAETEPPEMAPPTAFPTPTPPAPTFPAPTNPPEDSGSSYADIALSAIGISLAVITYMAAT